MLSTHHGTRHLPSPGVPGARLLRQHTLRPRVAAAALPPQAMALTAAAAVAAAAGVAAWMDARSKAAKPELTYDTSNPTAARVLWGGAGVRGLGDGAAGAGAAGQGAEARWRGTGQG